jgi:DNA primase
MVRGHRREGGRVAGPLSQELVEAVRNAGDLLQLVSDYVPLKKSGRRYTGLCPFHQEKTPSFSVDPDRQLFYCFGCQVGGDLFRFVELYDKVDFPEAVRALARRFGVPIPERGAGVAEADGHERLFAIADEASRYFRARLVEPRAGAARDYLVRRGVGDEIASRLGIGYAPESWNALLDHLHGRGYDPRDVRRAGLAVESSTPGRSDYDRFRNRIVFPIRDVRGRTMAFGGRALGDDEPKYINSPETPIYHKGDHLYGLDLAREAIRREGFAIVVEGYLDTAAVAGAGLDNVVASLGTAFTPAQARLLARYTNRLVFSYDGDAAGAAATTRSLDLLLGRGFDVRVAELPGTADPDDCIREHGPEEYARIVRSAPEYLAFLIRREIRDRDVSRIDEQVAALNALLPHIARLEVAVERASWSARLADALGVDDELVLQELRKAVRDKADHVRQRAPGRRPLREAEARLVTELLRSDEQRAAAAESLDPADLERTEVASIVNEILELEKAGTRVDYPTVLKALPDEDDRDLLTRIAFRDEPEDGPTVEDCLVAFRRQRLTRETRRERREIGAMLGSGSDVAPNEVDRRLRRLEELARQRDGLS